MKVASLLLAIAAPLAMLAGAPEACAGPGVASTPVLPAQAPGAAERWLALMRDRAVADLERRHGGPDSVSVLQVVGIPPAPRDPGAIGLVFLYFDPRTGGNSFMLDVAAYRVGGDFVGLVELYGESPREPAYGRGTIDVTTTMPREADPRCCPTGWTRWRIDTRTLRVKVLDEDR